MCIPPTLYTFIAGEIERVGIYNVYYICFAAPVAPGNGSRNPGNIDVCLYFVSYVSYVCFRSHVSWLFFVYMLVVCRTHAVMFTSECVYVCVRLFFIINMCVLLCRLRFFFRNAFFFLFLLFVTQCVRSYISYLILLILIFVMGVAGSYQLIFNVIN